MTVAELRIRIVAMPQDLTVVFHDFESSSDEDIEDPVVVKEEVSSTCRPVTPARQVVSLRATHSQLEERTR
jgi:hypothetical protein